MPQTGPDLAGRQILAQVGGALEELTPLWVTPDDILLLTVRNILAGVQLQILGRLWTPDGEFSDVSFTFSPGSAAALQIASQGLQYGYLVSVGVQAIGATLPRRGQTYCTLQIARSPVATYRSNKPLTSGYVTSTNFLAWPGGRVQDAIEGPGFLQSVLGTVPAAGVDWSQTVPANQRWKIRSARATLTTSAAIANRFWSIAVDDGVNILWATDESIAFTAGNTNPISWMAGYVLQSSSTAQIVGTFPIDTVLFPGWRIRSLLGNIQGGDQWTAPRFLVESWIED